MPARKSSTSTTKKTTTKKKSAVKKEEVARSLIRVNYPESTMVLNYYSSAEVNDDLLNEFEKKRSTQKVISIPIGIDNEQNASWEINKIASFKPLLIPAEYIQSIRGL